MYGKQNIGASKQVVCVNTNELFSSATMVSKFKNCNHSKLCMCCREERKTCGKDDDGTPLQWMYYEDYLIKNNVLKKESCNSLFLLLKIKEDSL